MHVADSIENILKLQIDAFSVFRDLLLRQHAALTQRSVEAIEKSFSFHAQCVRQLEILDSDFKSVLATAGVSQSANRVEHILAILPMSHRSRLQSLWSGLLLLATECRTQNAVNNRLVGISRLNTEAALRVLKGQGSVPTATYAQDGKVTAQASPAAIATA